MGLLTGGLAPVELSLFGLGLVGESVFLCGAFGLACGFCSCINSLGATGFLIPEGAPGRLLERFGPPGPLAENPGLFWPPPRFGGPERTGTPPRLFPPGRFWPCLDLFAKPPPFRLATGRLGDPGRLGPPATRLLEPGRFDNP